MISCRFTQRKRTKMYISFRDVWHRGWARAVQSSLQERSKFPDKFSPMHTNIFSPTDGRIFHTLKGPQANKLIKIMDVGELKWQFNLAKIVAVQTHISSQICKVILRYILPPSFPFLSLPPSLHLHRVFLYAQCFVTERRAHFSWWQSFSAFFIAQCVCLPKGALAWFSNQFWSMQRYERVVNDNEMLTEKKHSFELNTKSLRARSTKNDLRIVL